MIKELVKKEIDSIIERTLGHDFSNFDLEHPQNSLFGDYTLNVSLKASKVLSQNPLEIAKRLSAEIERHSTYFEIIDVVSPGFINLTVKKQYLIDELQEILELGKNYGMGKSLTNKKLMVEYTDPNPFKEFHVGHLYSNIVGESLCRLFEFQGATVWRVNYQGDVGLHVAKSLWGVKKIINEIPSDNSPLSIKAAFMGKAYALGATAYEEDGNAKKEIIEINKNIYDRDPSVFFLWQKGKVWSLEYFEQIYRRLDTNYGKCPAFNRYYPESEASEVGAKLVKEGIKNGIFVESEGAVVFLGEKYNLHTRVFMNSQGLPTYEAKELGLAPTKYKDFSYDESIIITGNEINDYFKVLLKALELISPELGRKTKHLSHGMVRLPEGKMSSRTGKVIRGEWLLDEAKKEAQKIIEEVNSQRFVDSKKELENISEVIGVGAIKYAFLRSSIGKDIEFDFKESVNFEGNSGPYLQYTYARARSVLRKAQDAGYLSSGEDHFVVNSLTVEEDSLIRTLYKFPEIANAAAASFQPHLICTFLFDLAQKFNLFYNNVPILAGSADSGSNTTNRFRIALTASAAQIISNGLRLLGIKSPERM